MTEEDVGLAFEDIRYAIATRLSNLTAMGQPRDNKFLDRLPYRGVTLYFLSVDHTDRIKLVWEGRRVDIVADFKTNIDNPPRYRMLGTDEAIIEARLRGIF